VWSARFEAVARRIWALTPIRSGDKVLDIGTGTGIVPKTLSEATQASALLVGCDCSAGMLQRARTQVAGLRVVVCGADALPFRDECFDLVTASFVLSHVRDYPRALSEALRVLKHSSIFAVTTWAPSSGPYSAAWSDCLAEAISKTEVERAFAEVIPWEDRFSQPGALETVLSHAGFVQVRSVTVVVESDMTLDQFLEDRELSSSGRLGLHLLGEEGWARFRAATREKLQARLGQSFRYRRDALIVTAKKQA
jgi:SAM-dependent methyltransferase